MICTLMIHLKRHKIFPPGMEKVIMSTEKYRQPDRIPGKTSESISSLQITHVYNVI